MATRKTAPRGKRPRGGLRSRAQAVAERDPVWDTAESAEDEEGAEAFPKASSESHTPKVKSDASGSTSDEGLLSLMRRFLDAQEQREERHLAELQGLREVILQSARPPETPSDLRSLRMSLPTPAASRTAHAHSTDTPASQSSSQPRPTSEPPRIPVFQQGEDIESYLRRFERLAKTWGWPVEEWSFRLVPLLTGQALDAYLAMDEERAGVYADLKEALLEKFNISAETYRQRFRASTTPAGESPTETYNRLRTLYCRWVRPDLHTKEEIGETIILEQLLRVLPYDSRTWVREHEPTTGLAAAKLALQYMNAHRRAPRTQPLKGTVQKQNTAGDGALPGPAGGNISVQKPKSERQELVCFYCQQPGHKASVCPVRKAKLTGFCYVPREEDNDIDFGVESQMLCDVTVDGHSVKALLDTGSSLSLLKPGFVSKIDYATTTTIQCVHGDIRRYPRAEVVVCAQEQSFLMNVVIVDDLPGDMILGRDLPVLFELLQTTMNSDTVTSATVHKSCPVVTRAQAKEGLQPLPYLHCSLLQGGTKGPRKPRRQRRLEKYLGTPVPKVSVEGLKADDWRIPENIGELQRKDESLKSLFEKAASGKGQNLCDEKYVIVNNVLYLQSNDVTRLIVPKCCRPLVLHLAHTIPWGGHLGQQKTYTRITSRFHWPSLYTDVQTYCNTCATCQKTSVVTQRGRAPLYPLPVISTPFRRIAMDIVGPLERSSAGHQYILVICDYATRYPEAFPLRSITTPKIIQALVQLFSRVGIPEEILTDQGTNFTSRLMGQLHRQLGITAIRTSAYHPQTDGLTERFNQTLKNMLRKFVSDTGRDWDKWLPFLLFAYREVPQASTGFSPFELLYGWQVQGPLDLIRKSWEDSTCREEEKGIVQYVLEMRDRLEHYQEQARENLKEAQKAQKTWYDQNARQRQLQPGQKVLLLLPTSANKLLTKWQGPYTVVRKMGPVTYEIHHPDKGKAKQTYHINLLKEWKEPPVSQGTTMMVREVSDVMDEEPESRAQREPAEVSLEHLQDPNRAQLRSLLEQFPTLFCQRPGRTELIHHTIHLTDPTPSRQRPYRVPERLVEPLKEEVKTMLEMGVIEPSRTAYLDDVVIFSKSWEEHLNHLKETLNRIQEARLTLNVRKCEWARQETKYLGYHLGNGKLRPQVDKVEAIQRSPRPRSKKEMRSFLGLVGWYRRFIPDFATVATPLTNLLAKAAKSPIEWSKDCETAFRNLKERICSSPVLQSPDFNQRFLVQVDASATGVGAVLAQGEVGAEKPVVYISRKLLPRETRYSTVEKECLATKWSLESLRYYLLGREFDLETDHRALTWIQTMKDHNSRVMRWYLSLQPYKFKVRHRPGRQNVVADYLSRYPNSTQPREGGGGVIK
ncbi:hypothetical protein QQF64_034274 [Cirrhinus molitorella]|uniref:Gypsy retrotransposon integrase-like protein 1 n=1 Tax=Cirrhinus molitorella TaxID=172907 RepID=A0ABR3L5N3_9TELE